MLVDFDEPANFIKDFDFLGHEGLPVQENKQRNFHQGLRDGGFEALGMTGGDTIDV